MDRGNRRNEQGFPLESDAATVAHRVHPRERGRRPPVGRDRALAPAALLLLDGLVLLVACGFMLAWELGMSGVTAP